MRGNVTVAVESVSTFAGQRDVLRFSGRGTLTPTEYGYHLRYTAANDVDGAAVTSEVKLEKAGRRAVIVNESGSTGYGLLLDPAADTATRIEAEGGALTLNVSTQEVRWDLGARQGSIDLAYTLLMGKVPMSALCLRIKLKEEKETK